MLFACFSPYLKDHLTPTTVDAWVVVSNEGRITFLGGIDVDPTRTGMVASLRFNRRGIQKWKMSYDDIGPINNKVSTFFL